MFAEVTDGVFRITQEQKGGLFENRYPIPEGICYNSYVIIDEKTAVLDTMHDGATEGWFTDLEKILDGRRPDYLVVHHMEPDHAANIDRFLQRFPFCRVVASSKAVKMMNQFFQRDFQTSADTVGDGDVLELGRHSLRFIEAPMVHWPEVLMSYDLTSRTLFSADAFGRFGLYGEPAEVPVLRYYWNIVGKFGAQVQKVLSKASELDFRIICPLHGNVLDGDFSKILGLYDRWSKYEPVSNSVAIIVSSFYGHTRAAADLLSKELYGSHVPNRVIDLSKQDPSFAIAAAFYCSKMVVMAPTYEGGLSPHMDLFLRELVSKKYQKRKVAVVENGSWGPAAGKAMHQILSEAPDIEYLPDITILSSMSAENREQIAALAASLKG